MEFCLPLQLRRPFGRRLGKASLSGASSLLPVIPTREIGNKRPRGLSCLVGLDHLSSFRGSISLSFNNTLWRLKRVSGEAAPVACSPLTKLVEFLGTLFLSGLLSLSVELENHERAASLPNRKNHRTTKHVGSTGVCRLCFCWPST